MSSKLNPDWEYKLKPFKSDITIEEKTSIINTINQFERDEIFNHNYDEKAIFQHIYKESSPAKRQPNPFMVFRMILGLIAAQNKTKLGDGTQQSKVAGYMWGGATKEEKTSFNSISHKFKDLHKEKFPHYEYKPKQRTAATGTFAEPITRSHYENYETENVVPNQQMLQETFIPQQTSEDSNMYTEITTMLSPENALDTAFILNGDYPQQPVQYHQFQQQQQYFYQLLNQADQILEPQDFNLTEHQMNQQLNVLDNMNALEKFDYSSQPTPTNTLEKFGCPSQSAPTIALNCIGINQLDPNQPIHFNSQPFYYNNNNW